jgi:hypothetical protein
MKTPDALAYRRKRWKPAALLTVLLLITSWTNTGSWTAGYITLVTSKEVHDARLFLEKYLLLGEPALKPEAFRMGLIALIHSPFFCYQPPQ